MKNILRCKDVKKKYRKNKVLNGITFEINKGDIMGFIGPNGSGKTTTIKLILGLGSITSGSIHINGYNIKTEFIKAIQKVGAIVENPDSYTYLSGYDNLLLISNLYENITKDEIHNIVKLVGLEKRINDKVNTYSLGMKQRLGIAKALIMKPNLLILDEPTNGLDPEGISELRKLLKQLVKKEGMGVLISSHNLSELESFCNKVCIINNGEVIENIDYNEMKEKICEYTFVVSDTKKLKLDGIISSTKDFFIIKSSKNNLNDIIKYLIKNDINIYEIKENKLTLEELFLKKTGGSKID